MCANRGMDAEYCRASSRSIREFVVTGNVETEVGKVGCKVRDLARNCWHLLRQVLPNRIP